MGSVIVILTAIMLTAISAAMALFRHVFNAALIHETHIIDPRNRQILTSLSVVPEKFASALLFAQIWCGFCAFAMVTVYLPDQPGSLQLFITVFVAVCLGWTVTDLLPRFYVRKTGLVLLPRLLPWFDFCQKAFYPFAWLTMRMAALVARYTMDMREPGGELVEKGGQRANGLTATRRPDSLDALRGRTVRDVMLDPGKLQTLDISMPLEEMLEKIFASKTERLLMIQDTPDMIVGILHTRAVMASFCQSEGDKHSMDITSAISEPVFVAADTTLLNQFAQFLQRQEHFALVRDQGRVIGAISLERIFSVFNERTC